MIEARGDNLYRGLKRIGWFSGHHLCDDSGKKLCLVSEDNDTIYDMSGKKLVYIKEGFLYDAVTGRRIDMDDSIQEITAVGFSNIQHVAISMFFAE